MNGPWTKRPLDELPAGMRWAPSIVGNGWIIVRDDATPWGTPTVVCEGGTGRPQDPWSDARLVALVHAANTGP